jgi:hypothetical protein
MEIFIEQMLGHLGFASTCHGGGGDMGGQKRNLSYD